MEIEYKTKKLQKACSDAKAAEKQYGQLMAERLHQRIDQISAADSIDTLVQFGIGRCHPLTGDRNGQYAMDLVHPYRLVFKKKDSEDEKQKIVLIIEIVDYH